jgi:hypothetical protein
LISIFFLRDVAQLGSALRSGRRGRWFESSHPDFFIMYNFLLTCLISFGVIF